MVRLFIHLHGFYLSRRRVTRAQANSRPWLWPNHLTASPAVPRELTDIRSDDRNADRLRQKKFEDAKESKTDAATDRSHCMRVNWISVAEACRRAKRRCFVCHSHPSPTRRSSQNALVVLKWPEVRPRGYCVVIFALSLGRIFHKCVLADLHRPQEHWNAYYQTRNASYNLYTFATVNNWWVSSLVYRT